MPTELATPAPTAPLSSLEGAQPLQRLIGALQAELPQLEVRVPSALTREYAVDASTRGRLAGIDIGPAVAFPSTAAEVQVIVRTAAELGTDP